MTLYNASSIGCYVKSKLTPNTPGKVQGITSKGAFLLFDKTSVFVTNIDYESPFNIVISSAVDILKQINANDSVVFDGENLTFDTQGLVLSLDNAVVWTPPLVPPTDIEFSIQYERALKLLQFIRSRSSGGTYLFLSQINASTSNNDFPQRTADSFSNGFKQNHLEECLNAADRLFGLGSGLTPSADDWLTGFILYHRLVDAEKKPFLTRLGAELLFSAYRKTTFVSANRLEGALLGWSENLFIQTIDFLQHGNEVDETRIAEELMNFGHSSGVDTYCGIAAACASLL